MDNGQSVQKESLEPALCVDLDGTLIMGDSLKISLKQLALTRPWVLPRLVLAGLRGRAWFKHRMAELSLPDPSTLPYRPSVLEFVCAEHQRGRRIILATAADRRLASTVASHLGIFDGVISSNGLINAKGEQKARAIQQYLAFGQFDYMGDSVADIAVFRQARFGYLVAPSPKLETRVRSCCVVIKIFAQN